MPDEPKRLCIEPNKYTTRKPKIPTKPLSITDKMTSTKVASQRTDTKTCLRVAGTAAAPLTGRIRSVIPMNVETPSTGGFMGTISTCEEQRLGLDHSCSNAHPFEKQKQSSDLPRLDVPGLVRPTLRCHTHGMLLW
jgi:hypothetical protein